MIKKILIFTFLAFLAYKASTYYFFYTSSKKLASCPSASKAAQAKELAKYTREELLASTKAWRCLKLKQNFAEAYFFKMPDSWLNPSMEYVNPPFTEAELNSEVTLVDGAIKRDLQEFRKIFSDKFVEDFIANIKLAKADAPETGYQRINESLKVLIPELREFKPESTKFASLKTQLAYSLSQVKQNNTDAINLHNKANFIMGSSEVLLAKSKEEIRQHKQELLRNQSELDTLVFQLENNVRKQEDLGKELLKTSDEIDALYKIYS